MKYLVLILLIATIVVGCNRTSKNESSEAVQERIDTSVQVHIEKENIDDCDTFVLMTIWENLEDINPEAIGIFLGMGNSKCETHAELVRYGMSCYLSF